MGSLDLSEESTTRVGEAPVRGPPPTTSKLSSTEINRLLLLSCSEVAPQSLSFARVLVVPSAPTPVEVGPSELSPVTDTTAELQFTDASHAACSKSVVGIAPMLTLVEVVTSVSIQDVAISGLSSGWLDLSEESMTRVGELVTLGSS